MAKSYESLLEYKKSTGDWHYDPSIPTADCTYVGQIIDLDFESFKHKLPEKESKTSMDIWPEDVENGTLIPSQLSPNNPAGIKLDNQRWGYHNGNTENTQYTEIEDDLPEEFIKIRDLMNMDYSFVAIMKQDPGHFNPLHFDTYHTVVDRANLSEDDRFKVKRYLMFLEDWDWGHFVQVGNNVLTNWKAGQIYTWNYGMYHLTANAGKSTKWTCQITGFPNENSLHNITQFKFKLRG